MTNECFSFFDSKYIEASLLSICIYSFFPMQVWYTFWYLVFHCGLYVYSNIFKNSICLGCKETLLCTATSTIKAKAFQKWLRGKIWMWYSQTTAKH